MKAADNSLLVPKVSIIIPCKEVDGHTTQCVQHCLMLDYPDREILLLPDSLPEDIRGMERVNVITTGPVTPGMKRNVGVASSKGEICAFIDSDAYPRSDWLSNAIKYYKDPQVAAVGGPGLTPEEDSLMQRASGYVLSSLMVGRISSRFKVKTVYESNDIHSCNFVVKRQILEDVGGWDEKYWPGEDTLLCLAISRQGKRLIEASDVVVYHHRRPLFREHLKQVSRFGLHRGFFTKKFRGNSLKLTYLAPTLLVLSLLVGAAASLIIPSIASILLSGVAAYLVVGLATAFLQAKGVKLALLVWLGIIATHLTYGVYFLVGLLRSNLER